jgi:hypothetical protein
MALPAVTSRFLSLLYQSRRPAPGLVALEGERIGESLERTYWQTLREVLPLTRPSQQPRRRRRHVA